MGIFLVIAAIFAAGSFVQALAGFGSALVVMPVLSCLIGIKPAATVMALVGGTVTLAVLHQNRRGFRWGETSRLLVGTVTGIPIGTLALKHLPPGPVVGVLGAVLVAYGVYSLATRKVGVLSNDAGGGDGRPAGWLSGGLVGLCAGLLGGAYATDGPPLVVYGSVRGWSKESFRSILQACFLVDGILIIFWHGMGGLVTRDVLIYCLYGVPGMALGLGAGMLLDRRINHALFHQLLLWLIILLGAALLAGAFFARV